ncbi:MAG TPA: ABC transporter permease subunit [Rugosimonospora sp.]|jgi:hypothetical protein
MRLLGAELSRLVGRRFTKIMTGSVLLVLVIIGIGFAATSHHHNAATRAAALAQIQQIHQQQLQDQQDCEQQQKTGGTAPNGAIYPPGFDCSQLGAFSPTPDEVASFEPHQFTFRTDASDTIDLVGFLLVLLAFAVGASFVGAEWSSGGMMTLLLWRPRRLRVLSGKLAALLIGTLATGIVVSVAWVAGMWAIASTRGDASGITSGLLTSLALTDARALALILAAAVLGFCIASIGRHTATALGVAIGYVVIFELGARIVLRLIDVPRPERFFLSGYAAAWLDKRQLYVDDRACRHQFGPGSCEPIRWMIHMNQGAVVGGVLVAVVLLWTFVAFRRRDIT